MSDNDRPSLLIALGGNALNVPGEVGQHQKDEFAIARKSLEGVITLLQNGYKKIIITHGNGPQVGRIFLQQELTKKDFPRQVTLDVCVADSQGRIGYIMQNAFDSLCAERGMSAKACSIITQVVVAPHDPAFNNPTKPIGIFYSADHAERLSKEHGWILKEDAGRGYRRNVPSPLPLEIVENSIFTSMLDLGFIIIGAGGGGIPVIRNANGDLHGVEAVIDKDRTSALLANQVGIDQLVILTEIDHAYLNFKTPGQTPITRASASTMETHLNAGHFLEGSMKPKVESAINFLKNGGKKAIIANLFDLLPAIEGKTGTHILPD